jgi:hypothetical protein
MNGAMIRRTSSDLAIIRDCYRFQGVLLQGTAEKIWHFSISALEFYHLKSIGLNSRITLYEIITTGQV